MQRWVRWIPQPGLLCSVARGSYPAARPQVIFPQLSVIVVIDSSIRRVKSVAIIGAGISGITCAAALSLHVDRVTVYEKYANAGGRMASRRIREYDFDIGTQYFTVQDETFRSYVYSWEQDDLIRPWQGWFVDLEHGNMISRGEDFERLRAARAAKLAVRS